MIKNKKKVPTFVEVDGDVLELFFKSEGDAVLLHGANCQKIMGAGVAKQIRESVSPLFYMDRYDMRPPSQKFGSYSAVILAQDKDHIKIGGNLYTQLTPGATFDITALRNSLKSFTFSIPPEKKSNTTIYLPKIGCGIGGGKWEDVKPVIQKELAKFNVVVVNYIPTKTSEEE